MKKVIAVVGPIGAGKTTFINLFLNEGFIGYKLSQAIYDEADKRGMDRTDRVQLQALGDILREEGGSGILAKMIIEKIKARADEKIIIDSIRNHNELIELKKEFGENLKIVCITAPIEKRYERAVARKGKYKEQELTFEEFVEIDKKDMGEGNPDNGQNVKKCIDMAEITVENLGDMEELKKKVLEVIGN